MMGSGIRFFPCTGLLHKTQVHLLYSLISLFSLPCHRGWYKTDHNKSICNFCNLLRPCASTEREETTEVRSQRGQVHGIGTVI
ncbi:hypothetical protein scyTo_0000098 [Scyliorhinus torazame]|uniref:Uncharacterized protein n=1 Tax=Scyliorhinus torazame TaxID=75743 RepID=A0A401NQ48_SCYTO|nr:hypothetical protein [Scyliorhinus torazame]